MKSESELRQLMDNIKAIDGIKIKINPEYIRTLGSVYATLKWILDEHPGIQSAVDTFNHKVDAFKWREGRTQ